MALLSYMYFGKYLSIVSESNSTVENESSKL